MCRESTTGPIVEPTTKSFAAVTLGGSIGGRSDVDFMSWLPVGAAGAASVNGEKTEAEVLVDGGRLSLSVDYYINSINEFSAQ